MRGGGWAPVAAGVLVLAGACAGPGSSGDGAATTGSDSFACDPGWACAADAARYVGASVLYPGDGAEPTSTFTAQRGVASGPADPRPDPSAHLVAVSWSRAGVPVSLLGRTAGVQAATVVPGQPVAVRGTHGRIAICPTSARVTWVAGGWEWDLSAPDRQTALAEAGALRASTP